MVDNHGHHPPAETAAAVQGVLPTNISPLTVLIRKGGGQWGLCGQWSSSLPGWQCPPSPVSRHQLEMTAVTTPESLSQFHNLSQAQSRPDQDTLTGDTHTIRPRHFLWFSPFPCPHNTALPLACHFSSSYSVSFARYAIVQFRITQHSNIQRFKQIALCAKLIGPLILFAF